MPSGVNKSKEYQSRIREINNVISVFCKHCDAWHDQSNFNKSKGRYQSICKDCHRSRYSISAGYKAPSHIQKSIEAQKRRKIWLSEEQTCTICGLSKPRKDFYSKSQNRYLPYCCSPRRTWAEIDQDIKEQMKTCFSCDLRLPFDEFSNGGNGRDKKRAYCKCCEAARAKVYSDKPERIERIRETDDGTAAVKVLSEMLRKTEHCNHCGVRMTQGYPVTPSNKTIDHDVPLSRGGKHILSNITIMCLSCNSSKQARTLEEFAKVKKKMALI